jgi:methyl-accepting chemotaxis protein
MHGIRKIILLKYFYVNRQRLFAGVIGIFLFAGAIFLFGCRQGQYSSVKGGTPLTQSFLSKEELKASLNKFEEFFTSNIKQSASEIDRQSTDIKHHKLTLMYRARLTSALHNMLEQDDPLVAFIDVWALSVRLREYLESGQGAELFAGYQEVAVNASKQIEGEIESIARTFLSEVVFEETRNNINSFAGSNPIQGTFSKTMVYATETRPDRPSPFQSVVTLPLAPFRAMEGVDRGAAAIYKFSGTAEKFSDVVEELPESARWQLLLFLYELEEANMTKSFLSSLETISESSKRIAETAEKMPEQIRFETSVLLEDIDDRQVNIQTTLDKTASTAKAMEELIQKTDKLGKTLGETAESIEATADAWRQAAESTTETLSLFAQKEPKEKSEGSFTINDLRLTADSITSAASEIRHLNSELVENSDQISKQIQVLANVVTVRIVLLLVFIFSLVIAMRLFSQRMSTSKKQTSS